MIENLFRTSVF